jgi:hypothetical protein
LYDDPESKLHLYGIRYANGAIILGGGGPKGRDIIAWQDEEKLSREAKTIIEVSKDIMRSLRDGINRRPYIQYPFLLQGALCFQPSKEFFCIMLSCP